LKHQLARRVLSGDGSAGGVLIFSGLEVSPRRSPGAGQHTPCQRPYLIIKEKSRPDKQSRRLPKSNAQLYIQLITS